MPSKSPIKTITRRAQVIRENHPRMLWQTAMKQAGLEYRKKHNTSPHKKRRTPPCNKYIKSPRRVHTSPKGTRYCRKIHYTSRK